MRVQVVCDACGSTNQIAEEMSWRQMERAGVRLTSSNAMVAELVGNWAVARWRDRLSAADVTNGGMNMRAIRAHAAGAPGVLHLDEVVPPEFREGDILVRIMANGSNPIEWKIRSGAMARAPGRPLPACLPQIWFLADSDGPLPTAPRPSNAAVSWT